VSIEFGFRTVVWKLMYQAAENTCIDGNGVVGTAISFQATVQSRWKLTWMALSRAHTSAKATDFAKLLLLNKRWVTHPPM